jgi:hypothetical protein
VRVGGDVLTRAAEDSEQSPDWKGPTPPAQGLKALASSICRLALVSPSPPASVSSPSVERTAV